MDTADPYAVLILAVLRQAAEDWRGALSVSLQAALAGTRKAFSVISAYDLAHRAGYASPKAELVGFFMSEWCRDLCEAVGLPYDQYIEIVTGEDQ